MKISSSKVEVRMRKTSYQPSKQIYIININLASVIR